MTKRNGQTAFDWSGRAALPPQPRGSHKPRLAHVVISRVSGRRSASGDRATVEGYAQVEILGQVGDVVDVRTVSGESPGRRLRLPRRDVYATPAEHAHFGRLVAWFTEGITPPGERPPAPSLAVAAQPSPRAQLRATMEGPPKKKPAAKKRAAKKPPAPAKQGPGQKLGRRYAENAAAECRTVDRRGLGPDGETCDDFILIYRDHMQGACEDLPGGEWGAECRAAMGEFQATLERLGYAEPATPPAKRKAAKKKPAKKKKRAAKKKGPKKFLGVVPLKGDDPTVVYSLLNNPKIKDGPHWLGEGANVKGGTKKKIPGGWSLEIVEGPGGDARRQPGRRVEVIDEPILHTDAPWTLKSRPRNIDGTAQGAKKRAAKRAAKKNPSAATAAREQAIRDTFKI